MIQEQFQEQIQELCMIPDFLSSPGYVIEEMEGEEAVVTIVSKLPNFSMYTGYLKSRSPK